MTEAAISLFFKLFRIFWIVIFLGSIVFSYQQIRLGYFGPKVDAVFKPDVSKVEEIRDLDGVVSGAELQLFYEHEDEEYSKLFWVNESEIESIKKGEILKVEFPPGAPEKALRVEENFLFYLVFALFFPLLCFWISFYLEKQCLLLVKLRKQQTGR